MSKTTEILQELKHILDNFNKTPLREYTQETIQRKRLELKRLKTEFLDGIKVILKNDYELGVKQKHRFLDLYKKIKFILENKSKEFLDITEEIEDTYNTCSSSDSSDTFDSSDIEIENKMSLFDIQLAIKVIPEFQGDQKNLSNFLNLIQFLHDELKDNQEKLKLINFVMKTRLAEKVKNKVISREPPTNLTSLKNLLQESYKSNKTPLQITNELNSLRQNDRNVLDFASKIENLTAELNALQIVALGEDKRDIVTTVNDVLALNAFKVGLKPSLRQTIFAARPKTLQEAINIASEMESSIRPSENIFHFNHNRGRSSQNRTPHNRQFYRNQYNNVRYNQNSIHRNSFNNNKNYIQRNNNFNRNVNNNQYSYNRNYNQNGRFNKNNNIHVINSENGETPENRDSGDFQNQEY